MLEPSSGDDDLHPMQLKSDHGSEYRRCVCNLHDSNSKTKIQDFMNRSTQQAVELRRMLGLKECCRAGVVCLYSYYRP